MFLSLPSTKFGVTGQDSALPELRFRRAELSVVLLIYLSTVCFILTLRVQQ